VKTFRPSSQILTAVEQVLAENPSSRKSPLEEVTGLLISGRHYSWAGIYLALDRSSSSPLQEAGVHPAHVAVPGTLKKIVVTIKIGGREIGFLNVESDRESAFGPEDRVLLERVSGLLARFLTGRGKYIARRAASVPVPVPRVAVAA
jgi:putative methionine-R-sulfoxide reductase with GAF domain